MKAEQCVLVTLVSLGAGWATEILLIAHMSNPHLQLLDSALCLGAVDLGIKSESDRFVPGFPGGRDGFPLCVCVCACVYVESLE